MPHWGPPASSSIRSHPAAAAAGAVLVPPVDATIEAPYHRSFILTSEPTMVLDLSVPPPPIGDRAARALVVGSESVLPVPVTLRPPRSLLSPPNETASPAPPNGMAQGDLEAALQERQYGQQPSSTQHPAHIHPPNPSSTHQALLMQMQQQLQQEMQQQMQQQLQQQQQQVQMQRQRGGALRGCLDDYGYNDQNLDLNLDATRAQPPTHAPHDALLPLDETTPGYGDEPAIGVPIVGIVTDEDRAYGEGLLNYQLRQLQQQQQQQRQPRRPIALPPAYEQQLQHHVVLHRNHSSTLPFPYPQNVLQDQHSWQLQQEQGNNRVHPRTISLPFPLQAFGDPRRRTQAAQLRDDQQIPTNDVRRTTAVPRDLRYPSGEIWAAAVGPEHEMMTITGSDEPRMASSSLPAHSSIPLLRLSAITAPVGSADIRGTSIMPQAGWQHQRQPRSLGFATPAHAPDPAPAASAAMIVNPRGNAFVTPVTVHGVGAAAISPAGGGPSGSGGGGSGVDTPLAPLLDELHPSLQNIINSGDLLPVSFLDDLLQSDDAVLPATLYHEWAGEDGPTG